jgi:hypothetical protein
MRAFLLSLRKVCKACQTGVDAKSIEHSWQLAYLRSRRIPYQLSLVKFSPNTYFHKYLWPSQRHMPKNWAKQADAIIALGMQKVERIG